MPSSSRKFLVVDSTADNGALLARSLSCKFPSATVLVCQDSRGAIEMLATQAFDAIVAYRSNVDEAVHLVEAFKQIAPAVPIIAVSSVNRSERVLAAGATGFLLYEEWLRVGSVVQTILQAGGAVSAVSPEARPPG